MPINKLTPAQQFVVDKFLSNKGQQCCIHKHTCTAAWFQVNGRSYYKVSDSTIRSLVKKGLITAQSKYIWIFNTLSHD